MASAFTLQSEDTYDSNCALVLLPVHLVPFVAGALQPLKDRTRWETEEDYRNGYTAICKIEASLMSACANDLIESNRQLYRLLSAVFLGTQWSIDSETGQPTPEIPIIPDLTLYPGSILAVALQTRDLQDNAFNGAVVGDYTNARGMREQLEDLITAEGADDEAQAEAAAKLAEIALAVA